MVMAAIPAIIGHALLNQIEPVFRAVIDGQLVDSREKHFSRNIFIGACMCKYSIDVFRSANNIFDITFRSVRWLFIAEPPVAISQSVPFIYAIRASDGQTAPVSELINLPINCEQDILEVRFHITYTARKTLQLICIDIIRTYLVIAMYAEQCYRATRKTILKLFIAPIREIIYASVAKNDDYVFCGRMLCLAKLLNTIEFPMGTQTGS